MPATRGVFPGQQALPGGGVEPGERLHQTLLREVRAESEEALALTEITPFTFNDNIHTRHYADGRREEVCRVYLIFDCQSRNRDVILNVEFARVKSEALADDDLNAATRATLSARMTLTCVRLFRRSINPGDERLTGHFNAALT